MLSLNELAHALHISSTEMNLLVQQFLAQEGQRNATLHPVDPYPENVKKLTHTWVRGFIEHMQLGHSPKLITIAALKGGIGKTFLSTHVAVRASMFGAKVLLLDLDPEACATNSLLSEEKIMAPDKLTILEIFKNNLDIRAAIRQTKYEGLDIVPASLRIAKTEKIIGGKNPKWLLKKLVEDLDYDYIFFELPPSFSTLSSSAYLASDLIVIPCTPNIFSLESVDLTIEAVTEVAREFECTSIQYQVLMNMFNPHRNASQDTLNLLKDDHGGILLPIFIKESAEIQNAINAGVTVFETKCQKSIRDDLDELVQKLCPISDSSDKKLTANFSATTHQHHQQQQQQVAGEHSLQPQV